ALLTLANLIFAAVSLPESHHPVGCATLTWTNTLAPLAKLPRQLTVHRLSRLFTISFLGASAMHAFEATFALMITDNYGYSGRGIGELLAFAGALQAFTQGYLVGKIVERYGELRLVREGMIAFALGIDPMASL